MLITIRRRRGWILGIFIVLIVIFAAGFVIGGVGSGQQYSLSDIFGNNGGSSGSSGSSSSIKKLEKAVAKDPRDAASWKKLAEAYAAAGNSKAKQQAHAYAQYAALRPKDADGYRSLAAAYEAVAQNYRDRQTSLQNQAISLESAVPQTANTGVFAAALQDPISQAAQSEVQQKAIALQSQVTDAQTNEQVWVRKELSPYAKLVKLPHGGDVGQEGRDWYLYGQAAQSANELQLAVTAYKTFLKVDPNDDPSVTASVRQTLKQINAQLHPPKTPTTTTPTPTTTG